MIQPSSPDSNTIVSCSASLTPRTVQSWPLPNMDLAASLLRPPKAEAHDDALKLLNTVATSGATREAAGCPKRLSQLSRSRRPRVGPRSCTESKLRVERKRSPTRVDGCEGPSVQMLGVGQRQVVLNGAAAGVTAQAGRRPTGRGRHRRSRAGLVRSGIRGSALVASPAPPASDTQPNALSAGREPRPGRQTKQGGAEDGRAYERPPPGLTPSSRHLDRRAHDQDWGELVGSSQTFTGGALTVALARC